MPRSKAYIRKGKKKNWAQTPNFEPYWDNIAKSQQKWILDEGERAFMDFFNLEPRDLDYMGETYRWERNASTVNAARHYGNKEKTVLYRVSIAIVPDRDNPEECRYVHLTDCTSEIVVYDVLSGIEYVFYRRDRAIEYAFTRCNIEDIKLGINNIDDLKRLEDQDRNLSYPERVEIIWDFDEEWEGVVFRNVTLLDSGYVFSYCWNPDDIKNPKCTILQIDGSVIEDL